MTVQLRRHTNNVLFILIMASLSSRGLLEEFLSKNQAYMIQAASFFLALSMLIVLNSTLKKNINILVPILTFLLFIASISISVILTSWRGWDDIYVYVLISFYFSMLMFVVQVVDIKNDSLINIAEISVVTGLLLLIIAVMQQLGLTSYTRGISYISTFIRPSSTTGSYLHYPLIIALMAFVIWEVATIKKTFSYYFAAFVLTLAPILAFSRSGAMIIILSLTILSFKLNRKQVIYGIFMIVIVSMLFFCVEPIRPFLDRIITAPNINSAGNLGRIHAWQNALNLWKETNLIFGEYFGLVTNSTSNIVGTTKIIVESGFLQQLLNIGFVGCVSFYLLLLLLLSNICKKHVFLRAGFVAALMQTCVYQSIEVIPFMGMLILYPIISQFFERLYNN